LGPSLSGNRHRQLALHAGRNQPIVKPLKFRLLVLELLFDFGVITPHTYFHQLLRHELRLVRLKQVEESPSHFMY
jgi:hypothetical protein